MSNTVQTMDVEPLVARKGAAAPGQCELTILMPCLNEARTVGGCVAEAIDFIERAGVAGEVLVVDNGSVDGSKDAAQAAGARVVTAPARGYGASLMTGIHAAHGRFVIMGDADGSYDFESLDQFVEQLRAGADMVIGNRFAGGIQPGAMPKLHRYLGNPVLSFAGRLFFRSEVADFHCGLRGFRRESALSLDLRTTGMEFASELIVKATLSGQRVVEVPTSLRPDGRDRPPHLRSWHDGWRHLRFLLLYSPRWLFLYPGIACTVVGGVGALLLGSAVWAPGQGRFSEGLLVACSGLVVAGVQAALFAILAREFAASQRLLPPARRRVRRLTSRFTLEGGLSAAVVLIVTSLALLTVSLTMSWHSNPKALAPSAAFRVGALAVTIGVVGIQVALGSWFLSLLRLPRLDAALPDQERARRQDVVRR
jgi:hypothetical protein